MSVTTSSPPASLSPAPLFDTPGTTTRATSTVASSPPRTIADSVYDEDMATEEREEVEELEEHENTKEDSEISKRLARLQTVLQKSAVYSSVLKERMDADKRRLAEEQKRQREEKSKSENSRKGRGRPRKRAVPLTDSDDELDLLTTKRKRVSDGSALPTASAAAGAQDTADADDVPIFNQPNLITGAKLKPYQLEGLQWMVSLDQNGISGILADEMGLGKTLQTIAFSAYLREHGNARPFLVVCPLSVLHNWADEYQKFAPEDIETWAIARESLP